MKTKFMIVTNRRIDFHFAVKLRNSEIERVNSLIFLGIYIDDKLTFKTHIDILSKRVSSSMGVIFRISSYVPTQTLVTLYYSLVKGKVGNLPSHQLLRFLASIYLDSGFEPLISQR